MTKEDIHWTFKRLLLVSIGALLMAVNLKTFCVASEIIPGGFTGVAILFNEMMTRFVGIAPPFSIVFYVLNAIPAYIGFRYIGKWFSIYSCIMVFLTGIFTDWMPSSLLTYLNLHDELLASIFGGILNSIAVILCLNADATSGGTDFIAIYFSEKRGRDAWNYIFMGNCVILLVAAVSFGVEKAMYSIIFQFTATMTLTSLYKGYKQKTLLIITNKPDEVYALIRDKTHHGATSFKGIGRYSGEERVMLYSVVSSEEAYNLARYIKEIDSEAFVNILQTDLIHGRFYKRPKN